MNTIDTTLTTSGNSVAVRLPKELLRMSGLGKEVTLEARKGKIIISKAINIRSNWDQRIAELAAQLDDPTLEFKDMEMADGSIAAELSWDGPSFEAWERQNAKLP